jgi:hypothetical protein
MEAWCRAFVGGGVAAGLPARVRHPVGPNRRALSARPVSDWLGTPTGSFIPTGSLGSPFRVLARYESCKGRPGTRSVTNNPLSFISSTKRADLLVRGEAIAVSGSALSTRPAASSASENAMRIPLEVVNRRESVKPACVFYRLGTHAHRLPNSRSDGSTSSPARFDLPV